jgi:hypothetical protein
VKQSDREQRAERRRAAETEGEGVDTQLDEDDDEDLDVDGVAVVRFGSGCKGEWSRHGQQTSVTDDEQSFDEALGARQSRRAAEKGGNQLGCCNAGSWVV